jgi:short-subunit dehydrogenase
MGKAFDRLAMDAASVVRLGLEGLDRNRAIVVTGGLNKIGAAGTRFLPRSVVRKIAGAIKY